MRNFSPTLQGNSLVPLSDHRTCMSVGMCAGFCETAKEQRKSAFSGRGRSVSMPTPPIPMFSVMASSETGSCSATWSGDRRLPLISTVQGNRFELLRSFSKSTWMRSSTLIRFFGTLNFHLFANHSAVGSLLTSPLSLLISCGKMEDSYCSRTVTLQHTP